MTEPVNETAVATVTDADFETFTNGAFSAIDFHAEWCGPCHQLAPVFDASAATRSGRLRFGRCDVDDNPNVAARFNIMSIPTIVVIDPSGREVDRLVGAVGQRRLEAFLDASVPGAA